MSSARKLKKRGQKLARAFALGRILNEMLDADCYHTELFRRLDRKLYQLRLDIIHRHF